MEFTTAKNSEFPPTLFGALSSGKLGSDVGKKKSSSNNDATVIIFTVVGIVGAFVNLQWTHLLVSFQRARKNLQDVEQA